MNEKLYQSAQYLQTEPKKIRRWRLDRLCARFNLSTSPEWVLVCRRLYSERGGTHPRMMDAAACLTGFPEAAASAEGPEVQPGELFLTHPLLELTDDENRMLAAVLSLVRSRRLRERQAGAMACVFGLDLTAAPEVLLTAQVLYDARKLPEDSQKTIAEGNEEQEFLGQQLLHPQEYAFAPFIAHYMGERLTEMALICSSRTRFYSVEGIHDLRTGFRRMVSVCTVLQTRLNPAWTDSYMRSLRKILARLGEIRDLDVLLEQAAALAQDKSLKPACKELSAAWTDIRENKAKALWKEINSPAFTRMIERLRRSLEGSFCLETVDKKYNVSTDRVCDVFDEAFHDCLEGIRMYDEWLMGLIVPEHLLHRLRLAFKDLRYTLELFSELLSEDERELLALSKRMLKIIGGMHDDMVLLECAAPLLPKERYKGLSAALHEKRPESFRAFECCWDEYRARWIVPYK